MDQAELFNQILATWTRHQIGLIKLLDGIPAAGFLAKPTASRGRDVSRQLFHLNRVREGWLHMHATGERPKLPRADKGPAPKKADLKKALVASGKSVHAFLAAALAGEAKPRMFAGNAVRWMGYLISHESHHRGQILLALKQSGFKLPEKVRIQGVWGTWISGR